ncbi:unnamed protein product [Durusdinium trenchii]|uniref:Uncharacterized protein n=1 Tax=Durusdinium trenchii TaxID=1381693 RepID=A0ABP0QU00_9DINO
MATPDVWHRKPQGDDLEGLADLWDRDETFRRAVVKRRTLCIWPDAKKTGLISYETLQLNVHLMKMMVDFWCPRQSVAKTLPMDNLKWEAGVKAFRATIGLATRPSVVHCEAAAIKGFMSLIEIVEIDRLAQIGLRQSCRGRMKRPAAKDPMKTFWQALRTAFETIVQNKDPFWKFCQRRWNCAFPADGGLDHYPSTAVKLAEEFLEDSAVKSTAGLLLVDASSQGAESFPKTLAKSVGLGIAAHDISYDKSQNPRSAMDINESGGFLEYPPAFAAQVLRSRKALLRSKPRLPQAVRLRRGKGIGRRAADEAETGAPLLAAASAAVPVDPSRGPMDVDFPLTQADPPLTLSPDNQLGLSAESLRTEPTQVVPPEEGHRKKRMGAKKHCLATPGFTRKTQRSILERAIDETTDDQTVSKAIQKRLEKLGEAEAEDPLMEQAAENLAEGERLDFHLNWLSMNQDGVSVRTVTTRVLQRMFLKKYALLKRKYSSGATA